MSEEEEEFQSSNSCWICEKLIDDDDKKVRDHCHVTGKFRGAAHWSCKVPVIFHNLRSYNSHLILCQIKKFVVKIDVGPIRLEKYMTFFLNKKLVFIDSVQFLNSSLDKLVWNLTDNGFKCLTEEFGFKILELFKQKGAYISS